MSLTLRFAGTAIAVHGPFTMTAVDARDAAGRLVRRHTWQIGGRLFGADADAVAAARAALEAALAPAAGDLALERGAAVVAELRAADCLTGPRLARWEYPEASEADAADAWAFTLVFEAAAAAPDANPVRHETRLELRHDAARRRVFRWQGVLEAPAGTDVRTLEDTLLPATPAGCQRAAQERRYSAADRVLDYLLEDEELLAPLPAGLDWGTLTRTRHARDGVVEWRLEGEFAGSRARELAEAQRPAERPLTEDRLEHRETEGRVRFAFAYLEPAGGSDLLDWQERRRFETRPRFIDHKVLAPGAADYRQIVGRPDYFVEQEGEAAGRERWPDPPAPLAPGDLLERSVAYETPARDAAGAFTRYRTRWRFRMKPRAAPALRPPAAP